MLINMLGNRSHIQPIMSLECKYTNLQSGVDDNCCMRGCAFHGQMFTTPTIGEVESIDSYVDLSGYYLELKFKA